ncbi:MAG TPA: DUF1761 family protein [Thermodesulfobacteriota bacterium]|nr:DUF1761 family protein [Thermodesulfobacteriota bacterium]
MFILAVLVATILWFIVAAVLFFNPFVDKIYRSEEKHAAVRALPQSAKTIGMILLAVVVQSVLWAYVYTLVSSALAGGKLCRGLTFGLILALTKIIPRDIDRILLTTYPRKRMTIEFIVGIICSLVVGVVFGYML